MATPTYTTDLTDFEDFEAASIISTEVTGYTATAKGEDQEADFPIQGTQHASAEQRTAATGSLVSDYGSNLTWTSGDYFFLWGIFLAPNAVNTDTNAGIEMFVGPSTTQGYKWTVGGRDFGRYPYGGWQNFVVDPELSTGRTSIGAYAGSTYRWVGMLCDVTSAIAKGSPYGIDVIRYGRGEIIAINGEAADYATFTGMATQNDSINNKWGLFQEQSGSYLWKGLMSLGTATAVDFRDSGRNIVIDNTRRVQSDFNRIEINNASSNIEWTNINITALGTISKGEFEMIDNATVNMNTCLFTNMSTFIFDNNAALNSCSFKSCGQITHGGADFDSCNFSGYEGTADTAYLLYAETTDPDGELDNCVFEKGTTSTHAIEFDATNTPTTITLRGINFSGYNASNGNTDSALYFPSTSKSYTVNLVGCTGDISYKVGTGGSVTLIADPVTTSVTVKDAAAGTLITGARILVWVISSAAGFPYQSSISISGSGTTATVTHTSHNLTTGDNIIISGANEDEYNGVYSITVTDANTYTYDTGETVTVGTPTGTITATFAFISGVTTSTGVLTDTRVVSTNQPISGWVRKGTSSPYYIQGVIGGTVNSTSGFITTVQLVKDE